MIHIATAFDNEMAAPSLSLIRSLEACQQGKLTTLHVMFNSVDAQTISLIKKEVKLYHMRVLFYEAKHDEGFYYSNDFYPAAIFIRFYLFELLIASDINRVLYIDCDTIVRKDISELYTTDLREKLLGAVKDYSFYYLFGSIEFRGKTIKSSVYVKEVLFMSEVFSYFNSGVMLIDLASWSKKQMWSKVKDFLISTPGLVLPDQDALNHIIDGAYVPLDARWNALTFCKYLVSKEDLKENSEWRRVVHLWSEDPHLVHFAWISKPWEPLHLSSDYDTEYWKNLKDTSLYGYVLKTYNEKLRLLRDNNVLYSREPGAVSRFEHRRALAISKRTPPEKRWPIPMLLIKLMGEFCFTMSATLERAAMGSSFARKLTFALSILRTFGERCFYQIRSYSTGRQ